MPLISTLAHFSDLHLSSPEPVRPRELLDKRILGYLSWRRRRSRVHDRSILDAAMEDLRDRAADMLVITGDLTNLGFPRECREVRNWLEQAGLREQIMVVPGNHDAYVRQPASSTTDLWRPWFGDGKDAEADPGGAPFPYVRVRGDVALIGVNTAVPCGPLLATGRIGQAQLDSLEALLCDSGARGLCRVLAMHHPPGLQTVGWRKRLVDAPALRALLTRTGVEAVLHGHAHKHCLQLLRLGARQVPVVGVPATAATDRRPGRGGGYNLIEVHREEGGYELTISTRRFDPQAGFRTEGRIQHVA